MRLKRLVCRGFKSFADRTEFEFDNRLTGIIGPNGCGKSNVVDAIKWVLGDQRAKSLRGSEMTDVIFKGAEGRDAMTNAEVSITFELDGEGERGRSEISIGRRLTIDKESSYLLDGQEVRLKDIRDVLLDTGLGTGGYSVMEQGRIDAVLSANPEARRAIFEEAAGVSRFKIQKKEALRRLERTDQNLARVTDLLEERARRIRSLRIQAGKARKWHELQASLRDLRAAVSVVEGRVLRRALAEQRAAIEDAQARLRAIDGERERAALALAESDERIAACAARLAALQRELHACQTELSTLEERVQGRSRRAAEHEAEAAAAEQRSRSLEAQLEERRREIEEMRGRLADRERELIELQKTLAEQGRRAREAEAECRRLSEERDALRNRALDLLHERARARNAAHDRQVARDSASSRQARLAERRAAVEAELAAVDAQSRGYSKERLDLATRLRILGERERVVLADIREADAEAGLLADRESELQREHSQIEGRLSALRAMESHNEGLDEAPRHVLATAPEGLRGRLLDLLDIDLEYSAALEAALGSEVQALVVDTREHAQAIVEELKRQKLGRAQILVEQEFGEDLELPSLLPLPEGSSFLLEHLRQGPSATSRRMLAWLLRGVVLVDSIERADPRRPDLCFVTRDGSLLCGPRVEGGASAEGHAGLVVRRSQIAKLSQEARLLCARLDEAKASRSTANARVARLRSELDEVAGALALVRRRDQELEGQISRLAARSKDLAAERMELELEDRSLHRIRCAAIAELGRLLVDGILIERRQASLGEEEERLSARIAEQQAVADQRARDEQQTRLWQAQAAEAREGLARSIRMHDDASRDLEQALSESNDRAAAARDGAARAAAEAENARQKASELRASIERIEGQIAVAAAEDESARELRAARQKDLQEWDRRRSALQEENSQARLALAETEHRFQRLEDRLREETGLELLRCLGEVQGIGLEPAGDFEGPPAPVGSAEVLQGPPLPPAVLKEWYSLRRLWEQEGFDPAEARKEVQVLQAQKDRLGAVNPDAVAELEQEEGQFGTLEQEVADLKEARRSLLDTLRRLEAESKALFEQTFAEARKNFQEIFRKLFQGGKADMQLEEAESSLEAGIRIVAQPPGKQLQSIDLLSGGERSMTAVAILFALFKVRPSPFCILDEVDAALDETNVERFLRVLQDFVQNTQFCIVTHHKRTMAECQVLYGITMQHRGVSSRIAVNLEEVDRFRDPEPAADRAGSREDPAQRRRVAGEERVAF